MFLSNKSLFPSKSAPIMLDVDPSLMSIPTSFAVGVVSSDDTPMILFWILLLPEASPDIMIALRHPVSPALIVLADPVQTVDRSVSPVFAPLTTMSCVSVGPPSIVIPSAESGESIIFPEIAL